MNAFIRWLAALLTRLFHNETSTSVTLTASLKLPHPEEPKDPSQTAANVNVATIIAEWMINWQVPQENWPFWRDKVSIELVPGLQVPVLINGWYQLKDVPAAAYDNGNGTRTIKIRPEWLNKGVIAHENAHNSYFYLTPEQKDAFAVDFDAHKTDPLPAYLFSINAYGLSSYIEGHAELYRYLGDQMPEALKKYYPKLF